MDIKHLQAIEKMGWIGIVLLIFTGIAAAMGHIFDGFFATGDVEEIKIVNTLLFGDDFFYHWLSFREYPWARMSHMIPGIVFYVCLPLQFMKSVRNKYPKTHRISGFLVILSSTFLVTTAFIFAFFYPYVGFKEQVPTVFYSTIYIWCLYMAIKCVKQKQYFKHREWMVRVFSMGLGIYTVRVWYSLFLHFSDQTSLEFFATSFWIGMAFNLVVSEIWINLSRDYARQTAFDIPKRNLAASWKLSEGIGKVPQVESS